MLIHTNLEKIGIKKSESFIRPSSIPTAVKCAGYVSLQDTEPGIAAKTGIALHKKAERYIDTLVNKKPFKTVFSKDEEFVERYADFIYEKYMNKLPKTAYFWGVEAHLQGIFFNYLIEGTVDFAYMDRKRLLIADLKTGQRPLSKEYFYQLFTYALLFCETYKLPYRDIKSFHFLLWGRHEQKIIILKPEKLLKFKNKMLKILNSEVMFKPGPNCTDCFKFKNCAPAQNFVVSTLQNLKNQKRDIGKILQAEPMITKFYTQLKSEIMTDFFQGKKPPEGSKVVAGRRAKEWIEERMDKIEKIKGIIEKKEVMLSPSQAFNKKLVKEGLHWRWQKGKNKVVWSGEKGEALTPSMDAGKQFAKELNLKEVENG